MIFGGFFIRSTSIPVYFIWLKYISPFKYGFEILIINEMSGLTLTCKTSELINGFCPVTNGSLYVASILEKSATIWRGFVILGAISIASHILSVFFLYSRTRKLS